MFPSPIATSDEGKIYRVVSSPSRRLVALVMDTIDGEIRLFEGTALTRRGTLLLGATHTARGCAVAPGDGALVAATHDDLQMFDLNAGALRWRAPLSGDEPALAYAPDGALLAAGDTPDGVTILNAADGSTVARATLTEEPRALVWDAAGLLASEPHALVMLDAAGTVQRRVSLADPRYEAFELASIDAARVALAGTSPQGVWLEVRARADGAVITTLQLDDRRAEGLALAGGVLFLATEGGVYRADPPFDQFTQWLPPLGGVHDPTRVAALDAGHLAVVARDLRVFRTRS